MKTEELILEIIEKVHEQSQLTARKVDELQIEQVRQGELHRYNAKNLEVHMARTESNEKLIQTIEEDSNKRLQALEKKALFIDFIVKIVLSVGGLILFAVKVLPYLSTLV